MVLDKAMKWWAWRHVPGGTINDGGDAVVAALVGLGIHYWTAQGSVRGAVDFIQVGRSYYTIAANRSASIGLVVVVGIGYVTMSP
jgi:hypothetical protein